MIQGLSPILINDLQINVLAPAADYTTRSALAFMQSFYPPFVLSNSSSADGFDPLSVMVNNTYIDWPNEGYQYPMIQTFSSYSPEYIWINGQAGCTNADLARQQYYNGTNYDTMEKMTRPLYRAVAPLFYGTDTYPETWSYGASWGINEYLEYENRHNTTVNTAFRDGGSYAGMLPAFADLSNMKVWELYGDQTVSGVTPGDAILTMAGQTLAAKVLAHLQSNVLNLGLINKFNFVVGEYYPMLSLFSLLGLGDFSTRFQSVPEFGSSFAFEVFSYQTGDNVPVIPDPANLWVRFLFRNASDPMSSDPTEVMPTAQAYPMFHRGPSGTDMPWADFQAAMLAISTDSVLEWCQACNGDAIFCIPYLNSTGGYGDGSTDTTTHKNGVSPAVGGVIGAIVTLLVAGLVFAALAFFGGIRFYRQESTKKTLGGFKGNTKMASDADLNLPKNAAPAGITFDSAAPKKTHERVGSWELKAEQKDNTPFGAHSRFGSIGSTIVGRSSFDEDLDHDGILTAPVSPRESV
jgi:hypothetical protein